MGLTPENETEMLSLFEQYAQSRRYVNVEPAAEVSQASSSRDTGAISSGFVRRREDDDDEDTVSRPAPAMRAALRGHSEGDVNLETAVDLRKAKGGDKVSQLLRMISENDSRPAGGGSLSAGARNIVNQVLRPFRHCFVEHFQSNTDRFVTAFGGENWSHSRFKKRCDAVCGAGGVGEEDDDEVMREFASF
jgi:hypothetical protein